MCVLRGKPIKIPTKIAVSYVRYTDDISSTLLGAASGQMFTTGNLKLPVKVKVIQSLIQISGKVINICIIVKKH